MLATFIGTSLAALARAIVKGDLVAGSTYRQQLKVSADERRARQLAERRADKLDTQVDRHTEAIRDLTTVVRSLNPRDDAGESNG